MADDSLRQQVPVREEELALRLTQEPGPVTEDLFGCHGSALRIALEFHRSPPRP